MAFWNRKGQNSGPEGGAGADAASVVIVSLGGREDLLPDFAYPLGSAEQVLGREEGCDIQVVDGQISRQHMKIRFDPERGRHLASDLGSANGTYVNDVRLAGDALLSEGDVIQIGDSRLLYTFKRFKDHDGAMTYYRRSGERRKGTLLK